jgi:hypothetical protein
MQDAKMAEKISSGVKTDWSEKKSYITLFVKLAS